MKKFIGKKRMFTKEKRKNGVMLCEIKKHRMTFIVDDDIKYYLSQNVLFKKSLFINRAIRFYVWWLQTPIKVMEEAKRMYPDIYKWIGRKNDKQNKVSL